MAQLLSAARRTERAHAVRGRAAAEGFQEFPVRKRQRCPPLFETVVAPEVQDMPPCGATSQRQCPEHLRRMPASRGFASHPCSMRIFHTPPKTAEAASQRPAPRGPSTGDTMPAARAGEGWHGKWRVGFCRAQGAALGPCGRARRHDYVAHPCSTPTFFHTLGSHLRWTLFFVLTVVSGP